MMGGGGMYPGMYGGGGYGMQQTYGGAGALPPGASASVPLTSTTPGSTPPAPGGADLTGGFLGNPAAGGQQIKVPRVVPNPFDNTLLIQATPSEYEQVLKLLVEGHPNRVIADTLGIDLATVKKHVGTLMRKVGVKNRIALSVQVVNRKLLPVR